MKNSKIKKVMVNLPDEDIIFIRSLSNVANISFTDIIRRSINSEKFFITQEKLGNKILIEDTNRKLHKVVCKL